MIAAPLPFLHYRELVHLHLQFHELRLYFICAHDETFCVVAMCVCNPDRSPLGIDGRDPAKLQLRSLRLSAMSSQYLIHVFELLRESLIPIPKTLPAFHPHRQRHDFRFRASVIRIEIHHRSVGLESPERTVTRKLPARLLVENRNRRILWMTIRCQIPRYVLLLHCSAPFPRRGSDPRFSVRLAAI